MKFVCTYPVPAYVIKQKLPQKVLLCSFRHQWFWCSHYHIWPKIPPKWDHSTKSTKGFYVLVWQRPLTISSRTDRRKFCAKIFEREFGILQISQWNDHLNHVQDSSRNAQTFKVKYLVWWKAGSSLVFKTWKGEWLEMDVGWVVKCPKWGDDTCGMAR